MTNSGPVGDRPPTRIARRVILTLGEYGWQSLDEASSRQGLTPAELLGLAAAHFAVSVGTRPTPTPAPRFKPTGWGTPHEVRLDLARDDWARLDREAERQGISLERLLEHVLLLYLAELDSEHDAKRIHAG